MSLYQCVSEIELAIYTRKVSILPDKSEATKCLDSFRIFLFSSSFVFFVCLFVFFSSNWNWPVDFLDSLFSFSTSQVRLHKRTTKNF